MGNLARYSGASFVGINNNAYQIERAKLHTRDVESLCRFILGDYMQIPEERRSLRCRLRHRVHAPRAGQDSRVPGNPPRPASGGLFRGLRMVSHRRLSIQGNAEHQRIKNDIMIGNALPDIAGVTGNWHCIAHGRVRASGSSRDRALRVGPGNALVPRLAGSRPQLFRAFRAHLIGRALTNLTLRVGEKLRMVPEGSRAVSTLLNAGSGHAGRRRRVRCFYSDVFLHGPQTRRSGD